MSSFYRHTGKRLFDLLIALPALILLSPLLGILALLVRVKLGSPVRFRQQRPGLHGEPFTLVNFRTMTDARDAQGNLRHLSRLPLSCAIIDWLNPKTV
jgi:lipopolysaccharide/colanic/teichoic acid biosynthesis glycosyltransferase